VISLVWKFLGYSLCGLTCETRFTDSGCDFFSPVSLSLSPVQGLTVVTRIGLGDLLV
jgi:hypothetical protein